MSSSAWRMWIEIVYVPREFGQYMSSSAWRMWIEIDSRFAKYALDNVILRMEDVD